MWVPVHPFVQCWAITKQPYTHFLCPHQEKEHSTPCYVIEAALHTQRSTERQWWRRNPKSILCHLLPGAISLTKVCLHKLRGAEEHKGRWKLKLGAQQKGYPTQDPPRAFSGEPQPQGPGIKLFNGSQSPSTLGT